MLDGGTRPKGLLTRTTTLRFLLILGVGTSTPFRWRRPTLSSLSLCRIPFGLRTYARRHYRWSQMTRPCYPVCHTIREMYVIEWVRVLSDTFKSVRPRSRTRNLGGCLGRMIVIVTMSWNVKCFEKTWVLDKSNTVVSLTRVKCPLLCHDCQNTEQFQCVSHLTLRFWTWGRRPESVSYGVVPQTFRQRKKEGRDVPPLHRYKSSNVPRRLSYRSPILKSECAFKWRLGPLPVLICPPSSRNWGLSLTRLVCVGLVCVSDVLPLL